MVLGSSMNYTPEFSGASGFRLVLLHCLTTRMLQECWAGRQMAAFVLHDGLNFFISTNYNRHKIESNAIREAHGRGFKPTIISFQVTSFMLEATRGPKVRWKASVDRGLDGDVPRVLWQGGRTCASTDAARHVIQHGCHVNQ